MKKFSDTGSMKISLIFGEYSFLTRLKSWEKFLKLILEKIRKYCKHLKNINKSSKFENFLIDNPNKKLDGNYSIYIEQYAKMLCITECNAAVADLKHDRYSIYSVFCI